MAMGLMEKPTKRIDKFFCISDLHLGDRSKKDDFVQNEDKFISFLEEIKGRQLILVGDIFELWQCELPEVLKAYGNLIEMLFSKAYIYIIGNHDQDMLEFPDYLGVPIVEKNIIGNTLIMHGHQFDIVNARFKGLSHWVSKVGGWVEKYIDKDIDIKLRGFEKWLQQAGRFGTAKTYRNEAINFIKDFRIDDKKIDTVVLGHTHKKDSALVGGITYKNCGTWTGNNADFQIMEIEGGEL